MGETLSLVFRKREESTFEVQVKESWSGRTVSGSFVPPYTPKQLNALQKKLNNLESTSLDLRDIGYRLFLALCGSDTPGTSRPEAAEQSVQAVLRSVIQRTLRRRGTVALTLSFAPGCDEFVRYPWELLHNGDHFLLGSGIFTLTRALLFSEMPVGCELPVHPPMRVLYIGASPVDCTPLETEQSFNQLERALSPLIESGQVFLDRLEPPTFDQLVRYLSSYGGAGTWDDSETIIPCYVVHFDGHGAYGRLCPADDCETVNEPDARKCSTCGKSLRHLKPQTYLSFCDDEGYNRFIDTQSLRDLFLSSDVRLAVFSACETATVAAEDSRQQRRRNVVDDTLATALVMAQVPAVVAMPFSLQDDLSPTFMYHFYEALADGRTLEEGLARARQALLPMQQRGWFIPVLYRRIVEGEESPVPLLVSRDAPAEHDHPLAHLGIPSTFVGRERELKDLDELLTVASTDPSVEQRGSTRLRSMGNRIALTGSAGIGKSALAFEAVRRNEEKFPGGVVGISLQGGKSFNDALLEIIHQLHLPTRIMPATDVHQRSRLVLGSLRSLASRELPCLLLLDSFEEVRDYSELEVWLQFLCSVPQEVVVLVTSRSNPETMMVLVGVHCRWYEYPVGKMADADLLHLFGVLAAASGLDQRIHLDDPRQREILYEICTLLDGHPLGAELIFGTARSIGGRVYAPEAATRSLEEVRDELRSMPLAGILAVLEVSFRRLTPFARLLLAYLAVFKLPFSREQIIKVVAPQTLTAMKEPLHLLREYDVHSLQSQQRDRAYSMEEISPADLATNWRAARDELVQASFIQFDGRVYTIHRQVRYFAISHLPVEEQRRVHRLVAEHYATLPQPAPEEWFVAFEHLEQAGEPQDIQEAVQIAVRTSWALCGRGHAQELLAILRRAGVHASRLGDKTGEGKIQCCLGAVLRLQGKYTDAKACLRSSLEFHRQQEESKEAAWALYEMASLFCEEGNFRQGSSYAQEAILLFREAGETLGEAWTQLILGEISRGYARYYEALGYFEQALTTFSRLNNREGRALALRDRGTVSDALGQYMRALNDYEEAERLFHESGLRSEQAWTLVNKASVYIDQGHLKVAEKLCSEAQAIFREQGIRRGEAWSLYILGKIRRGEGELASARTHYEEARTMFNALGARVDLARSLNALGAVLFDEGEYLVAKSFYEQANSLATEQEAKQIKGRALRGSGDIARVFYHFTEAEYYYTEAAIIATTLDTPAEHCAVLRRQGMLSLAQKKYYEALSYWVQALVLDQRMGHPVRTALQQRVDALVEEQHLEETYGEMRTQYSL